MYFCPNCANLLLVKSGMTGYELQCQTCPYVCQIERPVGSKRWFKKKEIDDVLGGEDAWKNVDTTAVMCPKCEADRAYYFQLQIRSADEPMTTFYKVQTTVFQLLHCGKLASLWPCPYWIALFLPPPVYSANMLSSVERKLDIPASPSNFAFNTSLRLALDGWQTRRLARI
ncbi:uncharacterized protein BJ171DRAFT_420308 [Polychytrium aggregatum]|uniref:uncharacterized protein n=1 Tax=Polychytrium aggregatum TaxID=110093 RepID=UPI0022FEE787|nr:uncharacterized protein BJ171DRAFT_420308 [Polychytrium aggregatum]KAI9207808.1 hypothetical protein BJ171DRAFT_420308 [Polychytrium aggregatum]